MQPSSKMSTLKNTSGILTEPAQHTVHADDPKTKNLATRKNAVHEILEEFSKRSFYSLDAKAKDADAIDQFLDEKLLALSMEGEPDLNFYSAACAFMGPSFFGDRQQDAKNNVSCRMLIHTTCSMPSLILPTFLNETLLPLL
jgi:hypothetical protein